MLELFDVAIAFAALMLAISLIIMSVTQAVSSVLALRGARLRRGLEELIGQTVPSLKDRAKDLSRRILEHPLISDGSTGLGGRWRWASTIKRQELLAVLDAVLKEDGVQEGIRRLAGGELERLEAWFESFMSRVSQWFVMNTRWITIAFAVVLTFGLHLDSVAVLKQLSTESETRAKLTAMADSLLDQSPESIGTVESRYTEALKDVIRLNVGKFKEGTTEQSAPKIATRSQATEWIRVNIRNAADADTLVTTFADTANTKLSESLDQSIDRAKTLSSSLMSSGVTLSPSGHTWRDWLAVSSPHFWGMVASVLFLSLGAPFWFNVLKNMTSLKSAVARKDEEEKDKTRTAPDDGTRLESAAGERRAARATPTSLPSLPPRPKSPGR
jgi:hypothetical protein